MRRIAEDVALALGRFGPAAGLGRIVEAWPQAVGASVARNAWPARIARDGTLHVATSSSSWAFELAQLEADILERLRGAVGEAAPARLRFAVGNLPEAGPAEGRSQRPATAEPSPEQLRAGADLAAAIEDGELRSAVARAAALGLSRGGSDHPF